jgi:cell wall-associated NlpC family hydrolase
VDVAPLRAWPDDGAEQVTQALRGEPLEVTEQQDGWARVETAYGYPGWVREESLEDAEGELPPADAGSPVEAARSYLGSPYLWGGMTGEGIDCSGLVHMAYRRCGRLVPRDAWQQAEAGQRIADPEPGDVAVYADPGARPDHVAFWLGEGRILHATGRDGLGVIEEPEPPALRGRRQGFVRL